LLAWVAANFSSLTLLAGPAVEFEARGTVREEYASWGARSGFIRTYAFTAAVKGSNWFIELLPGHYEQPPMLPDAAASLSFVTPDSWRAGADGDNLFYVVSYESAPRTDPPARNSAEAFRRPGRVPFGVDESLLAVWYLFASADYLRARQTPLLTPLDAIPSARYLTNLIQVPARWRCAPHPPGLPSWIVMSNYSTLRSSSAPERSVLYPGFSAPHTNVCLWVDAWTNAGPLYLPARARLLYFSSPRLDGVGVTNRLRKRVEIALGSVTNRVSRADFIPPLPGATRIVDFRFLASNPPVAVHVLTNAWPGKEALAETYRRSARSSAALAVARPVRPKTLYLTAALGGLAGLAFLWFWLFRECG
jgi:hypothetical protein